MADSLPRQHQDYFHDHVSPLIDAIYGDEEYDKTVICDRLISLISAHLQHHPPSRPSLSHTPENLWTQEDILLITYGDSIRDATRPPLEVLDEFLNTYMAGVVSAVHILPFCPYSSDDGFAVIDYTQVNPELGEWEHIERIAQQFALMVDLVVNHASSKHRWFQEFLRGEQPGCDYFITVDPDVDLSKVTRPRNSPLLYSVQTPNGLKHVWATFSHDQIDLNFTNPDVLLEFIKIATLYLEKGTHFFRLDAIGYLWKEIGTPCIHHRKTHLIVRLLREVFYLLSPKAIIISETNVPNRENLAYFGNRNEAHLIYNFSLPPLLVDALLRGRSDHLKTWMMSMPPAPLGCAYLNFVASHDGIGMRPTEGLFSEEETQTFIHCMKDFGGEISMRSNSDGSESPYEINISLFDAMKGTVKGKDRWQLQRFICSQIIMMSLEGIPAFYIHSLLATENDYQGYAKTGRKRSINRHRWEVDALRAQIDDPTSNQSIVLRELSRLMKIRRHQPAFHPNATQYTLHLKRSLFAFWRQSINREQSIFSIHNLTARTQKVVLQDLNIIVTDPWLDLIGDEPLLEKQKYFELKPYQSAWITNQGNCNKGKCETDDIIDQLVKQSTR